MQMNAEGSAGCGVGTSTSAMATSGHTEGGGPTLRQNLEVILAANSEENMPARKSEEVKACG